MSLHYENPQNNPTPYSLGFWSVRSHLLKSIIMPDTVTVIPDAAETVYIDHPESSYGIFCFNSKGDLFLNSDWGFYGYAWRSFGEGLFKDFIGKTNSGYILGKFNFNHKEISNKNIPKERVKHLLNLIDELIKYCKGE